MITGIGTDIVEIDRINQALLKHGERFAKKILTEPELLEYQDSPSKEHFLAKRFAAKEAIVKALGTGLKNNVTLHDFTILHDDLGRPLIDMNEKIQSLLDQQGITSSHLSISDEKDYAIAFVIFESN